MHRLRTRPIATTPIRAHPVSPSHSALDAGAIRDMRNAPVRRMVSLYLLLLSYIATRRYFDIIMLPRTISGGMHTSYT